jgi:cytochrome P450
MQSTDGYLEAATAAAPAPDPFELPDTIQLASVEDPYPLLAAARRREPVSWEWPLNTDLDGRLVESPPDAPRSLNVLSHDAVTAVLRDHETYSSAVLAEVMGPVLDGALISLDEPEHRAHRALVAPAFRPRVLERWQDELVARVVDELLDEIAPRGRTDLVRALTFAFPVRVIARILGLPDADCAQFQRWSVEIINTIVNWDRGIAATQALDAYFTEYIARRRSHLSDDLVSDLLQIEIDGEHLSDDDILAFVRLLLPAGIETTYRSFGSLLFALLTHPQQLEAVRASRELHVTAIEEALRWETPLVLIPRRCARDTTLEGVAVPAGTDLNVFLGSANRDERRYPAADRFDVHRTPTPHVSFGSGPHACLGMHLARMESRVALGAVLERLPNLRLDDDAPPPRMVGSLFRSPDSLSVRFS